ncbi:MAG: glycosyltransferase family 4 protein [Parcubacteria group bacterium]|nr:glycosyltransferase family 4 protein [Parcubacteria group bacterium]
MKILILSDSYATGGGAAQIARLMAEGLKDRGHDVIVVASTQNKTDTFIIPIMEVNKNSDIPIYRVYSDYNLFWRAYRGLYNPPAVKEVKKIINDFKPDIVQANNIHSYISYHALKIAKKSGAKVFLTAHDVQLFHYGKLVEFIDSKNLTIPEKFNPDVFGSRDSDRKRRSYKISMWKQIKRYGKTYNPLRNIIIRHYLKYVDKIFSVSNALAEALNQNGITNVAVIHNGININEWQSDKSDIDEFKKKYGLVEKKIILFGGRLSETKGGRAIVLAMGRVAKEVPEACLLVLGEIDNYANNMIDLADKLGTQDKLVFTGWLTGESLKSAFNACDIVAVPSV